MSSKSNLHYILYGVFVCAETYIYIYIFLYLVMFSGGIRKNLLVLSPPILTVPTLLILCYTHLLIVPGLKGEY